MGALVEITEVTLADPSPLGLRAGFLDQPQAGAVLDARTVDVLGWALGGGRRAVAAELSIDGKALLRVPLRTQRPDLAAAFPDRKEARRAGFRTTLDLTGRPAQFELGVSIVLKRGAREQLGWICGRRRWRRDSSPVYARLASVVICCCGQARHLGEARRLDLTSHLQAAIESAIEQTYPHVEVLVVSDGSIDASQVASHHPRVRCACEHDTSPAEARNAGIRATNGDFLIFLDAEHRLLPDAIEAGVQALDGRPECAAAIGAGVPARAIYRRSLFEHVRGFDPAIGESPDLAFNLAIARAFPLCSYEASVAEHQVHDRDTSEHA